jgi:hypothetical protein
MTHRFALAAAFLLACALAAWSQNQENAQGCATDSPANDDAPRTRTQVTWVKNADGHSHAVVSPVKEMKIARLIFIGNPVLPLPLQDQIVKSLQEHDYDDSKDGLDELLE